MTAVFSIVYGAVSYFLDCEQQPPFCSFHLFACFVLFVFLYITAYVL